MADCAIEFIQFCVEQNVLCFGEFITKAGRVSPYFFNAGRFNEGKSLGILSHFYAQTIMASGREFDILLGPAYKGIVLAATTAVALAQLGRNIPFCYNRKEAKDHGEGGVLVGAPLKGRVLIVDDVISAGTSVRASVQLIREAGAQPAGVLTALDRMERGTTPSSAAQEVSEQYGIPVMSIASLEDLLVYLRSHPTLSDYVSRLEEYRQKYGAS